MSCNIDHLVIGANTLDDGVAYVQSMLGVEIPFGGVHPTMGTHNCLMQLGASLFLEVIAIHPDNLPPSQPRWYGLDDPFVRQRLAQSPTLLTWVVNTTSIDTLMSRASFHMGHKQPVSRGELNWYFSLPEDGRLLAGGLLPYAIEWQTTAHPAINMLDLGCHLSSLTLQHHQSAWLKQSLDSIDALGLVEVVSVTDNVSPCIVATINTPAGEKILRS